MRAWKLTLCLVFWAALAALGGLCAQAAGFSACLTESSPQQGGVLEAVVSYDGSLGPVAAFQAKVEYDPALLELESARWGPQVAAGAVTEKESEGLAQMVYTAYYGEGFLESPEEAALTYRFRVREDAPSGEYGLHISLFDAVDPEPRPIVADLHQTLWFTIPAPPSSDARLLSLTPSAGTLSPAFSPDHLTYTVTVPYEVTEMAFAAQAAEGARFWVNRKNLGSGGSDTLFKITVTAADEETKLVYEVTVHRDEKEDSQPTASTDARLSSLAPSAGTLNPTFSPDHLTYTVNVPYEVTEMSFTAQAAEGARFWVNRKNLGSGGSDTLFKITVTAADEETKLVYEVTVHRDEKEDSQPTASTDARLLSLTPSAGTLSPAFSPDRLSYTVTVPYEVTEMSFTVQAAEGARFWVNRKNLGSGGSDTLFKITVTAADEETKLVYEVTVHRNEKEDSQPTASTDARLLSLIPSAGTLSPAFSPDCLSYNITVPYEVAEMSFTAQAAEGARFWVNRKNLGAGGSDTLFKITVTAADEETKLVYEVIVHRNEKEDSQPTESTDARLLSLTPSAGTLSPAFSPDCLSYTITVPYEVTEMSFTAQAAEGARFWVNRKNLGAGGSDTLFKITVTAADEETKLVYEVTVHRNEKEDSQPTASADARLLSLTPSAGTLSPAFSPDCLSYNITVPYEVTEMSFTAQAAEGARFWVNRKNLGAGGSDTLFKITVTAADEETKLVYEVIVHRNEKEDSQPTASTDARLLSLTPSVGALSPAFSPDHLTYTVTVPYEVTEMAFTAQAAEGARFWVNRKNLGAGGSDTLFKITVTAADEETKLVYEVTVHRNEKEDSQPTASTDARLLSLAPSAGTLSPAFSPDRLSYTVTVPYEVTEMSFTAQAAEGARFWVNRKNLGAGGSDTLFKITVTAADEETKLVYEVTVHRSEKGSSSVGGAITDGPAGSDPGGTAPGESSPEEGLGSSGEGMETAPPASGGEEISPVPGEEGAVSGGSGTDLAAGWAEVPVLEQGQTSLLPGLLILFGFVVFGFLSGPLSKWLAQRFPEGDPDYKPKHPAP